MDLHGEQFIPLSKSFVWKALNNLDILKACIPGCEVIEWLSPTEIDLTVIIKLGPIKTRIGGSIILSNIVEGNSYTMTGMGKGRFAGLANGQADVKLESHNVDTGTNLTYLVTANVEGSLAKLGTKLVSSSAQKLSDGFFELFAEEVIKVYGKE